MFERFERPVRCADGHVFTTTWVPLVSVKAIRLGRRRIQRCPVGDHWTTITPIDGTNATPEELEQAAAVRDSSLP